MVLRNAHTLLWLVILLAGQPQTSAADGNAPASSQLPPIEYLFESAQVTGNHHTRDSFFGDLLGLQPGERVTVERLDHFRHQLMATGFFDQVEARLRPGSEPESVVVEISVKERNTIRIRDLFFGLSADTPIWGGLEVAETNLGGTGMLLSGGFVLSPDQGAIRLILADPLATTILPFAWRLEALVVDAQGTGPSLTPDGLWTELPFRYQRIGGRLGIGFSPTPLVDLRAGLRTEDVHLDPLLGGQPYPMTGILLSHSLLSTVSLQLQLNLGVPPGKPQEGFRIRLSGEGSSGFLGSDYQFLRAIAQLKAGFSLGRNHLLRPEVTVAVLVNGEHAPYFEGFYVGSFSPLVPGCSLGLQFTDRRSLDLLDNGADLVTYADRLARFNLEWAIPLSSIYGTSRRVEAFLSAGLFAAQAGPWEIGRHPDLVSDEGAGEIEGAHLDLFFNLGIRGDTPLGFFSFSLGNVLALAPLN
ncbi:MAG: hypothetical protein JW797_12105 [Bradymonadales bacterium]|nr:hypothetical protein [Bradymonadales bacterium]